ncbi:ABC transporter permease [Treponema sp. J25]|uniref:ABC transporter permease n=1 Tax=Treponema sp. J25 TaxID=2094121 RepID=UPI0010486435|nr:ABC transporter permease [Treponema sp. J25]TCW62451.1 sugar ABC transporter permease [Treponema sp. J25]
MPQKHRRLTEAALFWPLCVLVLLIVVNIFLTRGFLTIEWKDGRFSGIIVDILNRSTYIGIISVGLTLVIATGGIDISVGSVVAISGAIAAYLIGGELILQGSEQVLVTRTPMGVAIVMALLISTVIGLWNGFLVSRLRIQPIVATLVLMVAGRGIAQLITNGQIITIYYKPYYFIGNGTLLGIPFSLYILAFVLGVVVLVTRKTALGLFIEAIGSNRTASRYSGIREERILLWSYAFCSFCAGVSGLLVSSNVKSADGNNAGDLFDLDAILAVVIGGTSLNGGKFNLAGSVLGAIIIQTLTTTIYSIGVPPQVNLVIKSVVVFLVSMIQSENFRSLFRGGSRRLVQLTTRSGI